MLAVDTNVLVRYVANDDPAQASTAQRLIDSHEVWVSLTVLLETEWVLRSAHKLDPARIHFILTSFTGLPSVRTQSPEVATQAFDWFAQGMDFADALHLASVEDCEAFATFDRKFVATAKKAGAGKLKQL